MRDTDLLQLALGIMPPWLVEAATFDAEKRRLDIETWNKPIGGGVANSSRGG